MLPLFEDEPTVLEEHARAVCQCLEVGHEWTKTFTVWPGEMFVRLTWTCTRCGEIRGRA